jgi:phage terminase large subunit
MPPLANPQQQITDDEFDELHDYYLANPAEFVREVLGATPWQKQIDIINDVFKYSRVAVKTCNSVGKSYIAARIAVTYLMLYPDSIVVTTAPTWNQVKNVLWREIRTTTKDAQKISGVELTENQASQVELNIDTKWYAMGRSVANPDNFMGIHSDHLLLIVDEAGGIDNFLFQGFRAITTNINNKVLLIGNPTVPDGEFQGAFGENSRYIQHTISAFDTPNFTELGFNTVDDLINYFTPPPGLDNRQRVEYLEERTHGLNLPYSELIHPGDVYDKLIDWGVESDAWASLVMGEFPKQAANALIPAHLVTMAMNMYGIDDETGKTYAQMSGWQIPDGPAAYGQDMARFGADENVLTPRHGGWVDEQIIWNKKGEGKLDLVESAQRILQIINPLDDQLILSIDDTGNGGGTTDHLRYVARETMASGKPAHRYHIADYNFSRGPSNPDKFDDITSELYWNLRDQFMNKAIAMHPDEKLKGQLISRRWSINPKTKKIKVESKDEYVKRTKGKSPDRSDSLALSFARIGAGTWARATGDKPSESQMPTITTAQPQRLPNNGVIGADSPPSSSGNSHFSGMPTVTSGLDRRH